MATTRKRKRGEEASRWQNVDVDLVIDGNAAGALQELSQMLLLGLRGSASATSFRRGCVCV